MTESAYIGAGVSIVLFMLTHLGIAVWVASRLSTKVDVIAGAVTEMTTDIKQMAAMDTKISVLEQRMSRTEQDAREALKAAALVAERKR